MKRFLSFMLSAAVVLAATAATPLAKTINPGAVKIATATKMERVAKDSPKTAKKQVALTKDAKGDALKAKKDAAKPAKARTAKKNAKKFEEGAEANVIASINFADICAAGSEAEPEAIETDLNYNLPEEMVGDNYGCGW